MTELFLALLIASALRYFYFLHSVHQGLRRLSNDSPPAESELPAVSVIIPFRNESANLKANILSLLNQIYPSGHCEFIYVNDDSSDDYMSVFSEYGSESRIQLLHAPFDGRTKTTGKKAALETGIRAARGTLIVSTDADCLYHPEWLSTLAGCFKKETGFVSAPVAFAQGSGILSELQLIEFSGLVLCGAGMIARGNPMICNGANIAYRKELFEAVGGFAVRKSYTSGEDELLMRKIAALSSESVRFCFSRKAVVRTAASTSLRSFFAQRGRWASKGLHYPSSFLIFTLLPVFLFYAGFVLLPFVALMLSGSRYLIHWAVLFTLKSFFEYRVLSFGKNLLTTRLTAGKYLFAAILQPLYILTATIAGMTGRISWKGREVAR